MACAVAIGFQAWSAFPLAAGVVVSVDTFVQQMTVTVDGTPRYTWPVSTGRTGYATPAGSFAPQRLEREHYSREWDDAPMPYSIFFTGRGHAIHGTRSTKALGSPVSHGCVRLATENAARLFALVETHGLADTRVEIIGGAIATDVMSTIAPGAQPYRVDFDRLIRLLDGG
jgi:lipoprotein-anchoring transpeptidase ErfK/SrfK